MNMDRHVIQEELKNCPGIYYYPDINKLELIGRSIPENPELIFKRLDGLLSILIRIKSSMSVYSLNI